MCLCSGQGFPSRTGREQQAAGTPRVPDERPPWLIPCCLITDALVLIALLAKLKVNLSVSISQSQNKRGNTGPCNMDASAHLVSVFYLLVT